MPLHILLLAPRQKLPDCTPTAIFCQPSSTGRLAVRINALVQDWRERRRVERAYCCDLRTLVGMSERDLADFCAPCWLRSDVELYR